MKNHSFDDLVRQKVSDHEAPVPPGMWEAIAKKEKKKRRSLFFWWITGIVLLVGGAIGVLYKPEYRQKNTIVTSDAKNTSQTGNAPAIKTVEENNSSASQTAPIQSDLAIKELEEHITGSENKQQKQDDRRSDAVSIEKKVIVGLQSSQDNRKAVDNNSLQNNSGEILSKLIFDQSKQSTVKSNKNTSNIQVFTDTAMNSRNTTGVLVETSPFMRLSYQKHNRIAAFSPGKNLEFMTDSANINSRVMQYADSIKAATATTAPVINSRFKKDKWTLDISVTPFLPVQQTQSIPYLTRTSEANMQKSEYKADRINTRLLPAVSYMIGIYKKISPRLKIGTGLQYAMIKEKVDLEGKEIRTKYIEVQRLVNGSGGSQLVKDTVATTSSGTLTIDALNSYRFFSIPLSARYRLMERRSWSMEADGGMVINISSNYHNHIEGKFIPSNDQVGNEISFDLFAGFRVSKEYRMVKIFAEPVLRYNIHRHELSDMINRKFIHSAGLSLGVTYSLKHSN